MSEVNNKEKHAQIKKNIEEAYTYFKPNYDRFNNMRNFVFASSVSATEEAVNTQNNRPSLQAPILEPMISRLRGEFFKDEPSIKVGSRIDQPADPNQIKIVEGIIRQILDEANKGYMGYNLITDTLSGGYSASKIYTEYEGEKSFDSKICIQRTYDPTMTYWDPKAVTDDKHDGSFCGELFPLSEEEYKTTFDKKLDTLKFNDKLGGFQWSFKSLDKKTIIISDYYEKKTKKVKIVKLPSGLVLTKKEYEEFLKRWEEADMFGEPPAIVEQRETEMTTICRYRINECEILSYDETDYDSLPIVFVDGNSVMLKDTQNSSVMQMTRPLVLGARDTQKLKNYAMQALANELEGIQQSPWMIPKDGIPALYKDAWVTPQLAALLVYNQFKDDNPQIPLNPPQMVQRRPIPPEIMQTFMVCDTTIQGILGSYEATMADVGKREVSGRAIEKSMDITNSAAMPYMIGYMKGLQGLANRLLEMIPKVYKTARTVPIITAEGKREYVKINQEGMPSMDYDKDALLVSVEVGPSFGAQQEKAIKQMTELMQINPTFAQYMSQEGLDVLLNNMDFRDRELLVERTQAWMQQQKEMQAQAAQKPDPVTMAIQVESQKVQEKAKYDHAKLQKEEEQNHVENKLEFAQLILEKRKVEIELEKIQGTMALEKDKNETDKALKVAEMAIKRAEMTTKETIERQKMLDNLIGYELEMRNLKLQEQEKKDAV